MDATGLPVTPCARILDGCSFIAPRLLRVEWLDAPVLAIHTSWLFNSSIFSGSSRYLATVSYMSSASIPVRPSTFTLSAAASILAWYSSHHSLSGLFEGTDWSHCWTWTLPLSIIMSNSGSLPMHNQHTHQFSIGSPNNCSRSSMHTIGRPSWSLLDTLLLAPSWCWLSPKPILVLVLIHIGFYSLWCLSLKTNSCLRNDMNFLPYDCLFLPHLN